MKKFLPQYIQDPTKFIHLGNTQAMITDISSKRHVLMIDNYDSFTWNLYQYLHQSPKCGKVDVYRNDKITISQIENEIKPDIIFISPGPGHPLTDSGISRDIIKYFLGKIPIFGVCMGQECIFDVFGGDVSYAGEIVHGKQLLLSMMVKVCLKTYHNQ